MPSYEQNKKNKLWSVRFREIDSTGITHNKRLSGFPTKKAAQYGYEDYCAEARKNAEAARKTAEYEPDTADANEILFDDLLDLYYKYQQNRIKKSSLYELQSKMNKRILPYFTGKRMKDIKAADILEWQNETAEQYSFGYTSDLMTMLTAVYRYGEKYRDVTNTAAKVDRPRNTEPKKEMSFWTQEEFNKFRQCADNITYKTFFTVLYVTGCRRGEAEALSWQDVDFDNSIIKINKSLTRKSPTAPWELTTPKNVSSNRNIPIPPTLCRMLKEYKEEQAKTCKEARFVFGGEAPLASRTTDRYFAETCKKAEVKKIRLHDLRHSCASLLISKGVSIVAVSHQLGHGNIEQTLNTYSHLMPDDRSRIIEELDKVSAAFT